MSPENARRIFPEVSNEQRYRALLQSLSTFVWVADAHGELIEPQPGWEKYTGQGFDTYRGTGWITGVHPDDRAHVAEVWEQAVQSNSWYEVAWRCWHGASQSWRQCITRGVPITDQRGVVLEWIGSVLDVESHMNAELKRAQSTLANVNRELAVQLAEITTLYRTAPVGLTVFDRELRCLRINEMIAQVNGVPIEASLGRRLREYIPADLADKAEPILRKVLDTGEAIGGIEVQGRTAAGIPSSWLVSYHAVRDGQGAIVGVQVVVQDISARARAEAELKELNAQLEQRVMERTRELQDSEQRILAILDASSDAMVTIDASGKIITFSRSAVRLFGYSADEAVGQNVRILMPLAERERHDAYLRRYAETRKPHIIGGTRALNACRKDGALFPIELRVTEIGHLGLFVGCVRDMTSARALEQEVLNIARLEQRRIGQELHDGTQQELTGLGLLAQSLSEMIDREGATQAAELADRVATGIAQANAHVRALAHGLIPMPVDADGLPAALDELANRTQQRTGLKCRFECCEPLKLSSSEQATHLFRLAQEAVSNAVKHSGASTITIRLGHVNGELRLEIGDDGSGIDALKRPVVGVGLRLMQHRSTLAGGRLSVTPRASGGTVITCAIPAGTTLT